MSHQPTLQTERLILRPFELSDASEVQRLAGEKEIADTTLNIPHPYEDGMAENWISTHQPMFEAGEGCAFAIVLRDSGKLVGSVALSTSARFQRAELGYWIGKPYQNNGYATEASEAVLEYGFLSLNLNRIHASHMRRNPASGRVMEKLGMSREGCLRQHAERDGIFEDLEVYGLLRSEWERTARAISGREP